MATLCADWFSLLQKLRYLTKLLPHRSPRVCYAVAGNDPPTERAPSARRAGILAGCSRDSTGASLSRLRVGSGVGLAISATSRAPCGTSERAAAMRVLGWCRRR